MEFFLAPTPPKLQLYIMKITKTTWFYIIAALITIYGIVTRQFIFLILSFPLGLYYYTKGNDKKK